MTELHEGATIAIGCREPSHNGRESRVANFSYVDIDAVFPEELHPVPRGPAWWHDVEALAPAIRDEDYSLHHRTSQEELLDGMVTYDDALEAREIGGPDVGDLRARYSLTCKLCGLNVTVRHERLTPVLDRLAQHRVAYIELAHLAAIIR